MLEKATVLTTLFTIVDDAMSESAYRSCWMLCNWKKLLSLTQLLCLMWAVICSKAASDFVGHADYGVCSTKAMKYFGFKLHTIVNLTGVVMSFLLTPANRYDNQPVVERLDSFSHHLKRLLGDGAYRAIALIQTLRAIRTWEAMTRIAAKFTAHSVGMMVNQLLGRPPLHLAGLAS
jgi:hypothetical protein